MRKARKALGLMLTACMTASMFAGCGGNDETDVTPTPAGNGTNATSTPAPDNGNNNDDANQGNESGGNVAKEPLYKSLDPNVSGTIDIMVWSGDSVYYEDIGKKTWEASEITTQNVAAIYAMAKEFNKMYPNVKINLWAKTDDPNGNDTTWAQEMENFRAEHGKYPDIYASNDLIGDTSKGLVADLSVFSDDVLYQSFNKAVMNTMSYYGFQAGLPQFIQPWGVYVNKELAETNNIEVPEPNWTIDEYTEFVNSADGSDGFWGSMDTPLSFIATGTTTMYAQMANYSGTGDRINVASDEVASMLSYITQWTKSAIWAQNDLGNVPSEIMDDGWWWGYRFFCRNYCLTYDGDPWMLGAAAVAKAEDGTYPVNAVESTDWDIYPRPSTAYQGNTVGICVDPMAIHNYAMDDGNPEWSDAEKAKLELAYAFGSFWCGSTEAMQARANQQYSDNATLRTSLNDSFPLVTGDAFDEQMKIWYSTDTHARYGDENLMPGFHYILKLWEDSQFWDISDKCYPFYIMEDGTQKTCLYEWLNCTNNNDNMALTIVGAKSSDANWVDNMKARLSDFNTTINARFVTAETELKNGLKEYYGLTDEDFK
ncbi:MAG: hypothetical protein K2N63_14495 [Lachnospiraceae bacterium]|nr:hypothetical protein [Lachnospiraceae bacterium]